MTDAAYGMGMDAIDPVERTQMPGLKRRFLSEKKKDDDMAEQMRKLYVALTRAREKLIITDVCKQRRSTEESEAGAFRIRKADCFNALIYLALNDKGIAGRYIRYDDPFKLSWREVKWQAEICGFMSERILTLYIQHNFPKRYEIEYTKMEDMPL
jgi:ATP-dependent exoDNAse (exonuclease V) beta subunit